MAMRPILLALLLALSACATMRQAAGAYADFADKGVVMKTGGAEASAPAAEAKTPALPGGLVGDGEKHVYAEPSPRSS